VEKTNAYITGSSVFQVLCLRKWKLSLIVASLVLGFSAWSIKAQTAFNTETLNPELFRFEKVPVDGGAELVTIQARLEPDRDEWMPLVTVLRDTLGDDRVENDRLRYVWAMTYSRPTFWQKVSAAIPFFYTNVGTKQSSSKQPPPLMDLAAADRDVWNRMFWVAIQTMLLDPYGMPVRASTRSYERNVADLRRSHVIRALSLLTMYQKLGHERIFTDSELKEIQARLLLSDKTFGGLVDELKLPGFYEKEATRGEDNRGHNWELLRQQSEANGLYFEPLEMPDGTATHAMLWVAKSDLASPPVPRFEGRFLNIADPWKDKRLLNWNGYTEIRHFDSAHRSIKDSGKGAMDIELIPLALYGLDHPKIPALLVDFRDTRNPKRREMTRRAFHDVTRNVLALSQFGDVPYFLGRTIFDFVTGRRGMDINQPSRLKAYAQLKLLLSLNESLTPELRDELTHRMGPVSLNPMENGLAAEKKLANQQYEALLEYARRPDGLPAKLALDRRAELTKLDHDRPARIFFRAANLLSFGKYTHREEDSSDVTARLDIARERAYHVRFLREVARSDYTGASPRTPDTAPKLDVAWDLGHIRSSLKFLAEHGTVEDAKAVAATSRIFARTNDDETRRACLAALSQINTSNARAALLRISERKDVDQGLRDLSSQYLAGVRRVAEPSPAAVAGAPDQ
jgi:hypothetical protein